MAVKRLIGALALGLTIAGGAVAQSGLVVKPSAHGVIETLDRLEELLAEKGITVLARIDHAMGARGADMDLSATELLIFGNPKLGTPLMQSAPSAGIDLPMKALAWQDGDGKVWLAYNDPAYIAERHGIENQAEVITIMTGALDQLTDAATSAD